MKTLFYVCSDLHLTLTPPVARSSERDWIGVMEKQLNQLANRCKNEDVPLLIAGDVFDRHNPPAELIAWAISFFRKFKVLAIPGQHDLPEHRYSERHRSGYGALVASDAIRDIQHDEVYEEELWILRSAPWNQPIEKCKKSEKIRILMGHRYVWATGHSYPGAPESSKFQSIRKEVLEAGYDLSFWGDNHQGFFRSEVYNCGTVFRRKADERTYSPRYYRVDSSGSVETCFFDVSDDQFLETRDVGVSENEGAFDDFLDQLKKSETDSIDFREELEKAAETQSEKVKSRIRSYLETK